MQRERRDAEHLVHVQDALTTLKTALLLAGGEEIFITALGAMRMRGRDYAKKKRFFRGFRLSGWAKAVRGPLLLAWCWATVGPDFSNLRSLQSKKGPYV